MLDYLKKSIARKRARRITTKYDFQLTTFDLEQDGTVQFANWNNPLIDHKQITQGEVNFFRRFSRQGSFCIDIGANVGDTTVPMALAVGKKGLVIGFEPNPMTYEILEINAKLNVDKTNIVPIQRAITKVDGEFFYSSSEASFGNGAVSETTQESARHGKFQLAEKVSGINLQNYLTKHYNHQLSNLSLIKIDVEGHDKDVIQSITPLINEFKPIIIAECFGKDSYQDRLALFNTVEDLNYSLHYFDSFDEKTSEMIISANDISRWGNFNFYAVPK